MSHSVRGFTLVELLVALAIGAMLLLGARAVMERIADSADRTTATALEADRTANTDRVVRALFARAFAADDSTPFGGGTIETQFTSWCDAPGGWMERCTVTMRVVPQSSVALAAGLVPPQWAPGGRLQTVTGPVAVIVRTSAGDTLVLREQMEHAAIRYLIDAAGGGHWTAGWSNGTETPLAVGVVTGRDTQDTMILRIGERR